MPPLPQLTEQELQQNYNRMSSELQTVAEKIGELETEADEHSLVLKTLDQVLENEPDRKCFRLIGGVLAERTVKDVTPALRTTHDGIRKAVASLAEQYKAKEEDFESFKRDYKIQAVRAP